MGRLVARIGHLPRARPGVESLALIPKPPDFNKIACPRCEEAGVMPGTDRPHVIREAIMCCRKAGPISVPGVYVGLLDKSRSGPR